MSMRRDFDAITARAYDVVVIGGGIYGALVALEAGLRGLSCVLLEKDDFGSKTTFNSLRTLHGGLRYLQRADLKRHRLSAKEQAWFLRHFPELIHLQPILMPLYQQGIRRTGVLRVALWADRLLAGMIPDVRSERLRRPPSKVVPPGEVQARFPLVDMDGLSGGALWFEGWIREPQRLLMEILLTARGFGVLPLNYVKAVNVVLEGPATRGVSAKDELTGQAFTVETGAVINAAGPWSRSFAERSGASTPDLFHHSIAWNVLVDRSPLSSESLAVASRLSRGQYFFVHPTQNRMLIGTGHAPRNSGLETDSANTSSDDGPPGQDAALPEDHPRPTDAELEDFLREINEAVPGLNLRISDLVEIYSGYLPASRPGTKQLRSRALVVDHAEAGLSGFFSVSGVKYTEAHHVAVQVMDKAFRDTVGKVDPKVLFRSGSDRPKILANDITSIHQPAAQTDEVRRVIREEWVCHLDDIVFRRGIQVIDPDVARSMASKLCGFFSWDEARCRDEMTRVDRTLSVQQT